MLINLILTRKQLEEIAKLREREVSALKRHEELTKSTKGMSLCEARDFIADRIEEDKDGTP